MCLSAVYEGAKEEWHWVYEVVPVLFEIVDNVDACLVDIVYLWRHWVRRSQVPRPSCWESDKVRQKSQSSNCFWKVNLSTYIIKPLVHLPKNILLPRFSDTWQWKRCWSGVMQLHQSWSHVQVAGTGAGGWCWLANTFATVICTSSPEPVSHTKNSRTSHKSPSPP